MKSLAKNYAFNVVNQVVSIIVPFITTPYISRVLGVDAIGDYSYTTSVVSLFILFASFGFSLYGQREIAYCKDNKAEMTKTFYEIVFSRGIITTVLIVSYYIYVFFIQTTDYLTSIFLAQSLLLWAVMFDISWFYMGLENFPLVTIRNIAVKIVGVVFIFVFVKDSSDLWKYTTIITGSVIGGNILLWRYLKKELISVSLFKIRLFRKFKQVFELFVPLIAVQVYNVLDKTMIRVITDSSAENGYYEQTTKVISVVLTIVTSLGVVLLPRMSSLYAEGDKKTFKTVVSKAFKTEILLSCPLCLGMLLVCNNFVGWFFGAGYDKVISLIYIYAWVIIIIPLSNVSGYAILTPTGNHNKGTLAVILGAVTNFALNLILIRQYQATGAAIATIIAESIVTIVHLIFIKDYVDYADVAKYFASHLFAAAVMYLILKVLSENILNNYFEGILLTFLQTAMGAIIYLLISIFVLKDNLWQYFGNVIKHR